MSPTSSARPIKSASEEFLFPATVCASATNDIIADGPQLSLQPNHNVTRQQGDGSIRP
jgi:hypothetical protein